MKKTMIILLVTTLLLACSKNQTEEYGATVMTNLAPSESKSIKAEDVSIACVQGGEDVNGADIADLKEVVTDENRNTSVTENGEKPIKIKTSVVKKKIIKDGKLGLLVDNLQQAKNQIDTLVRRVGGYYAGEYLQNNEQESGYQLIVRIPVSQFDHFVNCAEQGAGKVSYKEVSARDVTEEFVDLESRLNSKRNSLARYNEILRKASSMKDIIQIEESIRVLQEEIESVEGRLRYLADCVNYSTLTLTISTQKDFKFKAPKRPGFMEKTKEAFADGWFNLVDFILELFYNWPIWILTCIVIWLARRFYKRFKNKRQQLKNKEQE